MIRNEKVREWTPMKTGKEFVEHFPAMFREDKEWWAGEIDNLIRSALAAQTPPASTVERDAEEWVKRNCEPILHEVGGGHITTGGFKDERIAKAAYLAGASRQPKATTEDYAINLQRMIECHCRNEALSDELIAKSPYLGEKLNSHLGASRPVKRLTDEDVDTVIQDTLGSEVKIYNEEMRDVVATIARAVRDACEGRK